MPGAMRRGYFPGTFSQPRVEPSAATDPPEKLKEWERERIRRAAVLAKDQYPGPVGEYLSRDLEYLALIGFRLDQTGLSAAAVKAILDAKPEA